MVLSSMKNVLGSFIADYKHKYRKKRNTNDSERHQILNIIDRLEKYDKYKKAVKRERSIRLRQQKNKAFTRIKKESFRRAYFNPKSIVNPYTYMYEKHSMAIDPNLEKRYKSKPIYMFVEFRYLMLPKSDYEISAGQAWGGLIKSWTGYRTSKFMKNKEDMKRYAFVTQRWADMLELPMIPDFDESSLESFLNSRKLLSSFIDEH
jgi:hypothetical protein